MSWVRYFQTGPSQLGEVSLARLAAAQAAWDPATTDAVPRADDIVFVPGQDHQFLRLRDIAHGQRFTFHGRLFEARTTLNSLEIRPTGQTVHQVAATFQHPAQEVFDVEIDDLEGNDVGRLTATAEHPFYLPDIGEYRPLEELRPGDRLLANDGSLRVVRSVSAQQDAADVFNFEVEYAHNYFVRPDGDGAAVLVHNTKDPNRNYQIDDSVSASTPVGRRGQRVNFPNPNHPIPRNAPTQIGGRNFSGHALDRMQERGFTPSVVENAIENGVRLPGRDGTFIYRDPVNNFRVVTNAENGRVITVF